MRALVGYADLKARIVPERLGVTLDLNERILDSVEQGDWEAFYEEYLEEQIHEGSWRFEVHDAGLDGSVVGCKGRLADRARCMEMGRDG
tara:strand:+ start:28908 stop:29174 length:267 start_codon:yes stop_codon:yes gene_type:complete